MSDTQLVPGTPEASEPTDVTTPESIQSEVSPTPIAEAIPDESHPADQVASEQPQVPEVSVEDNTQPQPAESAAVPGQGTSTDAPLPTPVKLDLSSPTIVGHISPDEFAKAQEAAKRQREEEKERKEQERKLRDEVFAQLAAFKEQDATFEVTIVERVKGGLRGTYNGMRVFLPASHYGMRKNVSEEELNAAIGQSVTVKVHELQSDETGFKSAVVSRRDLQLGEFWSGIEAGAVYDGTVTSITPFGVFVNIGGAEGLVHISRLSKQRVHSPDEVVRKGEKLRVTVTEVDREKKKLSLSHREHEADPWDGVAEKFQVGAVVKGIVRRITDFGAYVQVASRIEGLLRISELSWTVRVKHPSDILAVDQEIEVAILDVNAAKHQLALGYKQTQPNPWSSAAESLPIGTAITGTVQSVTAQGAVVRVNDTFDGFMPRSKMANAGPGKKAALNAGDTVDCIVLDINPVAASLILAMRNEDGTAFSMSAADYDFGGDENSGRGNRGGGKRGDRKGKGGHHYRGDEEDYSNVDGGSSASQSNVTLGDLLREKDKSNLNG